MAGADARPAARPAAGARARADREAQAEARAGAGAGAGALTGTRPTMPASRLSDDTCARTLFPRSVGNQRCSQAGQRPVPRVTPHA